MPPEFLTAHDYIGGGHYGGLDYESTMAIAQATPLREVRVVPPPSSDAKCPLHVTRVQFPSAGTFRRADRRAKATDCHDLGAWRS